MTAYAKLPRRDDDQLRVGAIIAQIGRAGYLQQARAELAQYDQGDTQRQALPARTAVTKPIQDHMAAHPCDLVGEGWNRTVRFRRPSGNRVRPIQGPLALLELVGRRRVLLGPLQLGQRSSNPLRSPLRRSRRARRHM
jgi:hypothetical protein